MLGGAFAAVQRARCPDVLEGHSGGPVRAPDGFGVRRLVDAYAAGDVGAQPMHVVDGQARGDLVGYGAALRQVDRRIELLLDDDDGHLVLLVAHTDSRASIRSASCSQAPAPA